MSKSSFSRLQALVKMVQKNAKFKLKKISDFIYESSGRTQCRKRKQGALTIYRGYSTESYFCKGL